MQDKEKHQPTLEQRKAARAEIRGALNEQQEKDGAGKQEGKAKLIQRPAVHTFREGEPQHECFEIGRDVP